MHCSLRRYSARAACVLSLVAIWDQPKGCCTYGKKWSCGTGCGVHKCQGPPVAEGYNDCNYGSAHITTYGGCPFVPPCGQ